MSCKQEYEPWPSSAYPVREHPNKQKLNALSNTCLVQWFPNLFEPLPKSR